MAENTKNGANAVKNLKNALESDIQKDFEYNTTIESPSCFNIKTINDWIEEAKNRPIPNMLFSELWYENETCILFADTNLGKSILALQISNSISKGISIEGFKNEVEPQKVMYFDFELSDKQIENRYSNDYNDHYIFNKNLLRVEINPDQEISSKFRDFEEYLCFSVEQAIIKHHTKIIVIDNLTYLKNDTEKAKEALPLMKFLNSMKKKYGLSILVLAHTPKRDSSKPLTKNDLSGSKMLMNFCDSCFAIGESAQEKGLRYIKQIKQRNTELIYDIENVIVCKIEKKTNFLEFIFEKFGNELEHLKPRNNDERLTEILSLKKLGISNTEIAARLGKSEGTVRKDLKKADNY
ncbi:RecA-family ATPase [Flavobacterium sp. PL11]|uniref:AAA family ATPase n=1 Tax=Flavobacterium sp. PL11 TaxID=3071717 RepID=UPI002DFC1A98|nr:RecA-family ATPase [Flavobacterium sp. PL11]